MMITFLGLSLVGYIVFILLLCQFLAFGNEVPRMGDDGLESWAEDRPQKTANKPTSWHGASET